MTVLTDEHLIIKLLDIQITPEVIFVGTEEFKLLQFVTNVIAPKVLFHVTEESKPTLFGVKWNDGV